MKKSLTVILLASLAASSLWAQTEAKTSKATSKKATATATKAAPAATTHSLLEPAALNQKAPDTFKAKFTTTKGDFVVLVTRAWSPLGADRFYNLVKNGFFTNVYFFRVVPGFVVQFGINGDPKIAAAWSHANIQDDPPGKASNKHGTLTFATAGANTRTTQIFINFGDNSALDRQGFTPFGEVAEGMDVVDKLYKGYGEQVTNLQGEIETQGNDFLKSRFPNLDSIKSAAILPTGATTPAKNPTPMKKAAPKDK
jgi:peptidyl-prolyl cis-trans isomerase A (cyclophilin A)